MRMLIKNGRVIDPASNTDDIRDILVEDGVIAEVAKDIDKAADTVIDAKGCMVMPGLVDLHVHFREPGLQQCVQCLILSLQLTALRWLNT